MKVRLINTFIFMWMIFVLTIYAHTEEIQRVESYLKNPAVVEFKAKLEEQISKRYENQISTQIDSHSFSVHVRVTFFQNLNKLNALDKKTNPSATPLPNKIGTENVQPEDISAGLINLSPLLDQYRKEIIELQALKNLAQRQADDPSSKMSESQKIIESLEIKTVDVSLGVDAGFTASYRRELEDWLKKTVETDFGPKATYKISIIKKTIKPEDPPKVVTPIEQVSQLQILIGFGILALVFFIMFLGLKFIPSRDMREQMNMALKIQEMKIAQALSEKNELKNKLTATKLENNQGDGNKDRAQSDNIELVSQLYQELQIKVYYLQLNMKDEVPLLFETWFEQGWSGRVKAASYMDAVLTRRGHTKNTNSAANLSLASRSTTAINLAEGVLSSESLFFPDKHRKDVELHNVFRAFPQISIEERYASLEQAYWDMLSMNILGSDSVKTRFGSLADLSHEKLLSVLSTQESSVKALAILHLPSDKSQDFLTKLEPVEKKKIFEDAIKLQNVREEQLNKADEFIKIKVKQEEGKEKGFVPMNDMISNLLLQMSPIEELTWLPEIVLNLPDKGLLIKKTLPSLAFINEWNDAELEMLFTSVDPKITASYLRIVPKLTDKLSSFYSPRVASILKDDLKSQKPVNDKEQEKNIIQLKSRLMQLFEEGTLQLDKTFKSENKKSESTKGSVA